MTDTDTLPERVLPQYLILLEVRAAPPALRGTYTIAKPPRLARATRGRSHDHDDGVEVVSRRRHRPDVKFKFIFHAESLTWPKLRLCTFLWNFISPQKMLKALVGSLPLERMKTSGVKFDESL